ncbi:MAG: site-specific DNA-methyltransferase [Bacteroidota bacterium]
MKNITHFLNQIIQGDCLEVMQELPEKSIDLILCDLPYGITANPWDRVIDMNKLWLQYERIIKDNGVIALSGQGIFTAHLILSRPELFRYKMVWIKSKAPNFLSANKQPLKKHEDICIFYKKQPVYHPQTSPGKPYDKGIRRINTCGNYGNFNSSHGKSDGMRYPYDLLFFEPDHDDWIYFKSAESDGHSLHPTQKPVELGRYLVRTFTDPGAVVLDNACGCGSYPLAALKENRSFIGIEKNQGAFKHKDIPIDFIRIAKQRIDEEIAQQNTTENRNIKTKIDHENDTE